MEGGPIVRATKGSTCSVQALLLLRFLPALGSPHLCGCKEVNILQSPVLFFCVLLTNTHASELIYFINSY